MDIPIVQVRKMTNYSPNKMLDVNTSFERSLSKLSENRKIFNIGSTVLKLMAVERSSTTPPLYTVSI